MFGTAEEYLPVGLLAVGFGYQSLRLRRDPRNPVLRGLAVMFGILVIAVVMGRAPIYLAFDQLVDVPNAARLVQHISAMAAFCAVQILLLYVARPADQARAGIRPRIGILVGVMAAMTVLFTLAPVDVEAPQDFVARFGGAAWVGPYLLLYLAYLGIGVLDVVRSCHRHAGRSGHRPWLRASFRMLVLAGSVGLAYVISKAAFTFAAWRGIELPIPINENSSSTVLVGAGAICAAVAVLLPTVGARLEASRDWWRQWRLLRALGPLWIAVCEAVPRVALPPSESSARTLGTGLADLRWSVYRRLVEIQDGLLDLRFYREPAAARTARQFASQAGLAGEELRAVVEATDIAAAIRAKQAGLIVPSGEDAVPLTAGAADLPRWLGRVAAAFAESPHVAHALAQLPQQNGHHE
ncbi:MAG: hypothetical protein QOE61_1528 [Micromonosporaceae bacterium]|nr:hypothetical protein [Micromonosporaceae bacterium]